MGDSSSLYDPHTVPTRYWHLLENGRLQCDVCPRPCRLHEGQRGLCFVRARVDKAGCSDVLRSLYRGLQPGLPVLPELGHLYVTQHRRPGTVRGGPADLARTAQGLGCRSVAFTCNDPVILWEYAAHVAT